MAVEVNILSAAVSFSESNPGVSSFLYQKADLICSKNDTMPLVIRSALYMDSLWLFTDVEAILRGTQCSEIFFGGCY